MTDAEVYPVPEGSLVVLRGIQGDELADSGTVTFAQDFARQLAERVGHDRFLVLDIDHEGKAEVIGPEELKAALRQGLL